MSGEGTSLGYESIMPQTYRSRAEVFARCLHEKLASLGGMPVGVGPDAFVPGYAGERANGGPRSEIGENELDDFVDYEVPYRVLRESSSTSDLEKHFRGNLCGTKKLARSGDALAERLTEGEDAPQEGRDVPAIRVTAMDELETDQQVKLRRCSSLKTWKTPPGTPGEKKIVRFADALGLDLADVRTFLDEIPKVPSSAYVDLQFANAYPATPPPPNPTLMPRFEQPGVRDDFLQRVAREGVCLETALLTDTAVLTVSGCVRVRNLAYEKAVHVRYTNDGWSSFSDLQATYIPHSCDGFSDRFSFVLYGHTLKIGEKLEFAVRLDCSGRQFWDNNRGENYVFECLPQSPSTGHLAEVPLSPGDSWSPFY